MSYIEKIFLKSLRKIYSSFSKGQRFSSTRSIDNPEIASDLIYRLLTADKPCMIGRFGSTELTCLYNYMGVSRGDKKKLDFVRGTSPAFWWEEAVIKQMQDWSGFFPPTEEKIEEFCELMLKDMGQIDLLGSWLKMEDYFTNYLAALRVHLRLLDPFWVCNSWTLALENKKVLVVHPFDEIIKIQYEKREVLFQNKNVLPRFASLTTIKAVQSLGEADSRFSDWFDALDFMRKEIDGVDYDVCLIGAGAYGLPLAAHVKRSGKKAVHLGGSLQLLFGIIGKRWENPNYGVKEWGLTQGTYSSLINENWVRPGDNFKPKNANIVEGACYW